MPLKAGDILFRIDPTPYEAQVKTHRGAVEALGHAAVADDAALRARRRTRLRRRAAAIRSRSAQGPARGRAVESRQDGGARAGRRLRHQPRAAQGRAGGQPAAVAGDGVHRYLGYPASASRSARSMRATSRPASRSRSPSSSCPDGCSPARSRVFCRRWQRGRRRLSGTAVAPKGIEAAPFVVRVRLDDDEFARTTAGRRHRRRRRSSPTTSRSATSSAGCCCGRWRSSTTSFRSEGKEAVGSRSKTRDAPRRA